MTPSLRPLTSSDDPILWRALYHAIHVEPGGTPPPRTIVHQPELARYVAGRDPDRLGAVAEADGEAVGAAWLRLWTGSDRGYGFVAEDIPELSMAVFPGWRGQGIGTRLLRWVLREAAAQHRAVSLSVSLSNPARRLYEREGFAHVPNTEAGGSVTMLRRF
ncbi:MAG: GNAT family N-acetyltransferase [Bacteroidota bacterium]